MTTATEQVKILRTNTDGVYYSIPESMKEQFMDMNEAIEGTEFGSDEWFLAHDEFNRVFNRYLRD